LGPRILKDYGAFSNGFSSRSRHGSPRFLLPKVDQPARSSRQTGARQEPSLPSSSHSSGTERRSKSLRPRNGCARSSATSGLILTLALYSASGIKGAGSEGRR
jgi:hypothetical protein